MSQFVTSGCVHKSTVLRTRVRGMHYRSSNLLRSAVLESFRSPMCSPTKGEVTGRVWSLSPCPRHPPINVDPPTAASTTSQYNWSAGEVSRQRVASFFPVASHCWLGAARSRGRQGARPCRGTPIVSATMPLAHCIASSKNCLFNHFKLHTSQRNVGRFSRTGPDFTLS